MSRQRHRHPIGQHDDDLLFLTFTAEEVGRIAVLIIKGVERSEAIPSMPRYSPEQHTVYAAFFDQLREVIMAAGA